MNRIRMLVLAAALAAALIAAAGAGGRASVSAPGKVTIAYQPGIGYAPLIVLKTQHTLEAQFPDTTFTWKVLSSGAAITSGMISGDIQIGAGGVGPLIVGWASGVDAKIVAPLDWGDLWLMAKDPAIKTIADLKGKKIAMPGPTSIQGVVLRKMAQAKLGDAHALDAGIISMDHPIAMQALLSGQIDAHLTSAPFQLQEKVHGAHVVARSYQYFGAHSFLDAWESQKLYDQYPQFSATFYKDVSQAIDLIKKNPTKVAHILMDDSGGIPTWRQYKQWLASSGLTFTLRPLGLMRFANFMHTINMIGKMPSSWKDLVLPPVYAQKGS
ncbi:MAG TPA: ABC transporter substrate-binding protein [Gaiellaceae bacterium]|nr:ABC transporter substrate-binding protein [Gaiellaceae bacterium]